MNTAGAFLSNLSSFGDIVGELPFPQIHVPSESTLPCEEVVRNSASSALVSADPALLSGLVQLLQNTDVSFVKFNVLPTANELHTPLLNKLVQIAPRLQELQNVFEQQPVKSCTVNNLPVAAVAASTSSSGTPQTKPEAPRTAETKKAPKKPTELTPDHVEAPRPRKRPKREQSAPELVVVIEDIAADPLRKLNVLLDRLFMVQGHSGSDESLEQPTDVADVAERPSAAQADKSDGEDEAGERVRPRIVAPVPLSLLTSLASEVYAVKAQLNGVTAERLAQLVQLLDDQLAGAFGCVIDFNQPQLDQVAFGKVSGGLECCSTLLDVLTAPKMPAAIYSDEVIDDVVRLVKEQLHKTVLAYLDPYGALGEADAVEPEFELAEDVDDETITKGKGAGKKPVLAKKKSSSKTLTTACNTVVSKICSLVDKLQILLGAHALTDGVILKLVALSMPCFYVSVPDGAAHSLQLAAISLLRSIFARYHRHRSGILEEIFLSLAKLPKNKRNLRSFQLEDGRAGSSQMVSALVMQLIQSCTALPEAALQQQQRQQQQQQSQPAVALNSYEAARKCAALFIGTLLERVIRSTTARTETSDYRSLLENFVDDLLSCLNVPEWPAAELLLRILASSLTNHMGKRAEQGTSVALVTCGIELLGKLVAKLRRQQQALVAGDNNTGGLHQQPTNGGEGNAAEADSDDSNASCICLQGYGGKFMIDCDRCHKWFHGKCVGVDPQNPPKEWLCGHCRLKDEVVARHRALSRKSPLPLVDLSVVKRAKKQTTAASDHSTVEQETIDPEGELLAMKHILLDYLGEKALRDVSFLHARQFYLSQWYDDETEVRGSGDGEVCQLYATWWQLDAHQLHAAGDTSLRYGRDSITQLSRQLSSQRNLARSCDTLIKLIVSVLQDAQATYRSKAIKALTTIIEADRSVLGLEHVQQAVRTRLLDSSVSVREATVDLVGRYLVERPEALDALQFYYEAVVDRILDTGRSVRKRVVKIVKDLCLKQAAAAGITQSPTARISAMCVSLASRINDEPSIRKLVVQTFEELLFSRRKAVSKDDPTGLSIDDIHWRTRIILDVVASSSSSDWLVELLDRLLDNTKQPESQGVSVIEVICARMCDCLINLLLTADEQHTSNSPKAVASVVNCAAALNVFCTARPSVLLSHATALHPYLKPSVKNPNKDDMQTMQHIAAVLEKVVPLMEQPDPAFLEQLERDLVQQVHTQGMAVIQSNIKCLVAVICRVTKNFYVLQELLYRYYQVLLVNKAKTELDQKTKLAIIRGMFVVGMLCKYHDFKPSDAATSGDGDPAVSDVVKARVKQFIDAPNSSVPDRVFNMYMYFSASSDDEIRLRALQGLGLLFVRTPSLMRKCKDLLSKSLAVDATTRVKVQALRNFTDFLTEEDHKNKAIGAASASGDAGRSLGSAAGAAVVDETGIPFVPESGLTGGLMQLYVTAIVSLLFDAVVDVRSAALLTVSLLVRHGLVNPSECVPHLVALLADHKRHIAERAKELLESIHDRHPAFLTARLGEGFRKSFAFQMQLFRCTTAFTCTDDGGNVGGLGNESIFAGLYVIGKKNKMQFQRHVMSALLKMFEDGNELVKEPDVGLLRFVGELLLSLPFGTEEEPIFIVQHLNTLLALHAHPVLDRLRSAFGTKHSETNKPSPNTDSSKFTKQREAEVGTLGKPLVPLLYLLVVKRFLRELFGLTDLKLATFSDNPQGTSQASGAAKPSAGRAFNAVTFSSSESPFAEVPVATAAKKPLAHLYKEQFDLFKRWMKEDELDFRGKKFVKKKPESAPRKTAVADDDSESDDYKPDSKRKKQPLNKKKPAGAEGDGHRKRKKRKVEEDDEDEEEFDLKDDEEAPARQNRKRGEELQGPAAEFTKSAAQKQPVAGKPRTGRRGSRKQE
eukprot:TRINITY_DN7270_c0_g1_i1.p1 TRINITY_DN7270_c0_g1~~TRINITY_DN7270_c0_g1_i1.p1  ORF type:complete len:1896 (-),score=444.63 TRINITY_DN7270_c0_g1_i1:97-5784(-)